MSTVSTPVTEPATGASPAPGARGEEPKPALSLNDLIGLHYRQVDNVHKLWNYLWLTGGTAVVVAAKSPELSMFLFSGFLLFALPNGRLVYLAQHEAYLSARAVKVAAGVSNPPLMNEVMAVVRQIDPWPARRVAFCHALITSFVAIVLSMVPMLI
ncbi:hypothetical protein [Tahibacter amnicola]|uniref:Uncharacterized protein n=1 Tax=Tahibacter amnicola TaxID=2976241 RepID=A0ABY6BKG4_9GAMM|nr:hypothetical protein [Tahibacter amnicola]UXI70262.1 hypothetical protein N4264_11685 [Tahibacter amnicola]